MKIVRLKDRKSGNEELKKDVACIEKILTCEDFEIASLFRAMIYMTKLFMKTANDEMITFLQKPADELIPEVRKILGCGDSLTITLFRAMVDQMLSHMNSQECLDEVRSIFNEPAVKDLLHNRKDPDLVDLDID